MKTTISLCLAAFLVAACDSSPGPNDAANTAQSASHPPVVLVASPTSPPSSDHRPAPASHNYSMEENGEYGYQLTIIDEQKNKDIASKTVVMVRFLGKNNGVYVIEMSGDAREVFRLECRDPCDYVETKLVSDGKVIKAEIMLNTAGSFMNAVFEDALGGQLKPYGKTRQ